MATRGSASSALASRLACVPSAHPCNLADTRCGVPDSLPAQWGTCKGGACVVPSAAVFVSRSWSCRNSPAYSHARLSLSRSCMFFTVSPYKWVAFWSLLKFLHCMTVMMSVLSLSCGLSFGCLVLGSAVLVFVLVLQNDFADVTGRPTVKYRVPICKTSQEDLRKILGKWPNLRRSQEKVTITTKLF